MSFHDQKQNTFGDKKEERREFRILIIFLLVLFLGLVRYFFLVHENIMSRLELTARDDLASLKTYVNTVYNNMEAGANRLTTEYSEDYDGQGFTPNELTEMAQGTSFTYIEYVTPEGVVINYRGQTMDVSDTAYYLRGRQGVRTLTYVAESALNHERVLIEGVPLFDGYEFMGMINGVVNCERVIDKQLVQSYQGEPLNNFVTTSDGTVIAGAGNTYDATNIRDYLERVGITSDLVDVDELIERVKTERSIVLRVPGAFSSELIGLSYIKSADWIIWQVIPRELSIRLLVGSYKGILPFAGIVITASIAYLIYYIRHEKRKKAILLEKSRKTDKMISGIINLYDMVIDVDLELDKYTIISEKPAIDISSPPTGRYSDLFARLQSHIVHDTNGQVTEMFLKPERLKFGFSDNESSRDFEYQTDRARGKSERLHVLKIDSNGEVTTRVVFALKDITEWRIKENNTRQMLTDALRQAEEAGKERTSFFASMSHDMRTPINIITGMVAIARSHIDDRFKILDAFNKIELSAKQLLALINTVLDMSKITEGKLTLLENPFNFSELIDVINAFTQTQGKAKNHEITFVQNEIRHTKLIGDINRVEQVINNLMSNAIKYTPDGGKISITVSEKEIQLKDQALFEVIVEDNGLGMSKEFQQRLFKPFQRATDDERIRNIQGTGLGMTITANYVHLMNGEIRVESELNQGSKFTVTMYIKLAPEELEEEGKEKTVLRDNFAGYKALVVEDNEMNAEILKEFLSDFGLDSEHACNGREAVDRMKKAEPDEFAIIFMDVQMPVMNGHDASRAIRKIPGSYPKYVPIIALTANALVEDIQNARNAEMNEHLAKPYSREQIQEMLSKYIPE